jgi:hypothetical protein
VKKIEKTIELLKVNLDLSPTPLLQGEGLTIPILPPNLPFRAGEGGWEGEVC